jgi:glycosyltransferase involved in cell wall biosynthesis
MKVSFVLPVYNVMPYLERCVQSLVCQTYKDFEIILVDDGSPDDSGKLCDELATRDKRIRVIHQENKGLSGARNTGIDNATGEYIIFVDSDDYWLLEDGLQTLVDNCEPQTDMVGFKGVDFWKGDRMTYTVDYNLEDISRIPDAQALFAYFVRNQQLHLTAWLFMVRRQLLLDHQIYFQLRLIGEDFYWHLELWQHLRTVKMLNLNLYAYCHRQGSMTTRKNLLAPYLDYDKLFTYWKERCQQNCPCSEAILGFLANVWINRGYVFYQLKAADKPEAFAILRKHVDLLDHAVTPKAKRTVKLLHLVGLRATVYVLGLYWRLRSRIKGNAV